MKSKVIICILMSIALLNTASAAGEGGVNIEPVVGKLSSAKSLTLKPAQIWKIGKLP